MPSVLHIQYQSKEAVWKLVFTESSYLMLHYSTQHAEALLILTAEFPTAFLLRYLAVTTMAN